VAEKFCLIAARQDRARKVFDRKCSKRKTDRPEPIGTQFKASLTRAVFADHSFFTNSPISADFAILKLC